MCFHCCEQWFNKEPTTMYVPFIFFPDLYDDYVLHNEPNFYAGAHASVAQAAGVASSRVSMLRVRFSFVFVFKRRRN